MGILLSIARFLSCFISCFRGRDDRKRQAHLLPDESLTSSREGNWTNEDNLANLFVSEGKQGSSGNTACQSEGFQFCDSNVKELKDEANFLKACGTIPETPVEIRNVPQEMEISPSYGGDSEHPKFQFLAPSSPINKLNWEEQPELPGTEAKHNEALGKDPDLGNTSDSFMSEEQEAAGWNGCEVQILCSPTGSIHSIDDEISAVTPELPSVATRKNKSVRFDVQLDKEPFSSKRILSKTGAKSLDLSDSSGSDNGSTKTTFATPLVITDDMQTPGTIYPSNQKTFVGGKDGSIRFQYVRSVLKPLDNFTQWETIRKEDHHSNQKQMGLMMQSLMQNENAYPNHNSVSRAVFGGRLHSRISDMDRPIIGVVAQHWNFNESSHIPDKFVIGNGIPNSTRKYKEDQKVSWHATPFEERLEKALSEDTLHAKRKLLNGRPIDFDDNEECVTD